ncbi:nucleotidyltransferase family protein [Candidatus Caldatribacterium sp. SIUC1]|uniref:nucleotidyltransferase family protein n=1 Tax=Candidatus Caldatribacterium sp. SIUC1 TaxID=3418365 RepID=UPI003F693129
MSVGNPLGVKNSLVSPSKLRHSQKAPAESTVTTGDTAENRWYNKNQTMKGHTLTLEEITEKLRTLKPLLQEEYGVRAIGVFGSFVRREETPESDLDILVEFERPIGLIEFVDLKLRLSEALGVEVDLVMKSALKPRIGKRILQDVLMV